MRVVWSRFAEETLDEIYAYFLDLAGERRAKKLIKSIIKHPEYLASNPKAGQAEELLQHREAEYRYIVFKNFKIIYSVDHERQLIKVADIFDTRQNPAKISREK